MKDYMNESILANYFRGIESVGGKIYFDETGLVFKSHSLNIQTGQTRIDYSQIAEVKKRNTLGIIPNGMSIITKDNKIHKFVIYNRSNVIKFLLEKI